MPGKNKPKRLNRQRSWRVARRKRRIAKLVSGGSRNRKPRAKNKGKAVIEKVEKVIEVAKKVTKKVAGSVERKVAKKTAKKE